MKKLSLFLLAIAAICLSGCKKSEQGILTWRVFTTPEGTEEAYAVVDKIDNVLSAEYGDLGKFTEPFRDGSAEYAAEVVISGKNYDDIYNKVAKATTLADEVLAEEMDYGELTQCKVVVTLFVDNVPTEMLNKEYVAGE